jgi:hypothetical protein
MAIENRNLEAGTKLAARYKGQTHTVLVLKDDEGKLGFELDNGTIYKSLSKAGSAVMNGTACNGWRFWSLEGDLAEKKEQPVKEAKGKGKTVKLIKRVPNQKGVAEGGTKWFCSSCMKSFVTDSADEPDTCPQGHPKLAEQEIGVNA